MGDPSPLATTPSTVLLSLNLFLNAFQAVTISVPVNGQSSRLGGGSKQQDLGVGQAGAVKGLAEEKVGGSAGLLRPGRDWLVGDETSGATRKTEGFILSEASLKQQRTLIQLLF